MAPPRPAPRQGVSTSTIVEKDAPATAISMGFPIDILRGSKDWYALAVANSWLGEHRNSSSHLYQVIREERGLNYGDYSYIENFPRGGMLSKPPQNVCRRQQIFEIWIRPGAERDRALRPARRAAGVQALVENGMTKEQFDADAEVPEEVRPALRPDDDGAARVRARRPVLRHRGEPPRETFRTMMDKLTLADVNAAIKKYWQFGNMQIAIVTKDAAALRDALVNDAPEPDHVQDAEAGGGHGRRTRRSRYSGVPLEERQIAGRSVQVVAGAIRRAPQIDRGPHLYHRSFFGGIRAWRLVSYEDDNGTATRSQPCRLFRHRRNGDARTRRSDPSYDGVFFLGVRTTGVFCRPTCGATEAASGERRVLCHAEGGAFCGISSLQTVQPPDPPSARPPAWLEPLLEEVERDPARQVHRCRRSGSWGSIRRGRGATSARTTG